MIQVQSQSQVQQGRDAAQFQLRLPDDLKARIQAVADASGRSLNSEIVAALIGLYAPEDVAARALSNVLDYIRAGGDDLEQFTRAALIQKRLKDFGGNGTVDTDQNDGSVVIRVQP